MENSNKSPPPAAVRSMVPLQIGLLEETVRLTLEGALNTDATGHSTLIGSVQVVVY
jgi:hypothetical protein